jgi:hypothetical protein
MAGRESLRTVTHWPAVPALPLVNWRRAAPFLIVFFSGANLMLIQWVMTREVTTLLLGTELVILLTSVSYFVGVSLGFRLAGSIQHRWLPVMGAVTLVLHLSLPVTFACWSPGSARTMLTDWRLSCCRS